jgi:hypothetical protein
MKFQSDSETNVTPETLLQSEDKSTYRETKTPTEDSDVSSDNVHDKIADHFAELERDQAVASSFGHVIGDITSNGMSSVTVTNIVRGPIIVNHTELTPIIECSPRESMASEPGELATTPQLVSTRPNDVHGTPPSTRHSQSSKGATSSASPAVSIHSIEKARTSSLTSQAERLRNKFLNRKPQDANLTVETDLSNPEKVERRMKFESFIRSGETMKMTLTPTSLRSIEVNPNFQFC